jgi:hypothetical protein
LILNQKSKLFPANAKEGNYLNSGENEPVSSVGGVAMGTWKPHDFFQVFWAMGQKLYIADLHDSSNSKTLSL